MELNGEKYNLLAKEHLKKNDYINAIANYKLAIKNNNYEQIFDLVDILNVVNKSLAEKYLLLAHKKKINKSNSYLLQYYMNNNDIDNILKYLDDNDPIIEEIYNYLGNYYKSTENYENAFLYYNKIKEESLKPVANYNIGLCYSILKMYDDGEKYFKLAIAGGYNLAYIALANLYYHIKDHDRCIITLSLAVNNNQPEAYLRLGNIYEEKSDYIKAEKFYIKAYENNITESLRYLPKIYSLYIKDYAKMIKYSELAIHNGYDDVLLLLGNYCISINNYESAEIYLKKAEQFKIKSVNLALGFMYYNKGVDYYKLAIKYNKLAIIENGDDIMQLCIINYRIANIYSELNNLENAEKYCLISIGYQKNDSNIYLMAKIYYEKNDYENSEKYFLNIDKKNFYNETYKFLGLIYYKKKKYNTAINYLNFASEYKIPGSNYLLGLIYDIDIGNDYLAEENYIKELKRSQIDKIKHIPTINLFSNIGAFYLNKKKNLILAEQYFKSAIETDKTAHYNLAEIYISNKKYELAINQLILYSEHDKANGFNQLAKVYEKIGKENLVIKYYKKSYDNGDLYAAYDLANYYLVKMNNNEQCEAWLLKAVTKNNIYYINLANFYYNNKKNNELAEKYYIIAYEKTCKKSLEHLINFYENTNNPENATKYKNLLKK